MSLKLAEKKDIENLINITEKARTTLGYPESYVIPFRKYLNEYFKDKQIIKDRITIINYDNNEPNGFISFYKLKDDSLVEISYLFILPEYQKKGVGSMLINTCEDIVKKFDVKRIKLGAEPKSIKFYFKHGYLKTDEVLQSAVFSDLTYPYVEKHL